MADEDKQEETTEEATETNEETAGEEVAENEDDTNEDNAEVEAENEKAEASAMQAISEKLDALLAQTEAILTRVANVGGQEITQAPALEEEEPEDIELTAEDLAPSVK